jgi:D-alanyl-D-alanine carboxypeptidase
MHRHTTTIRRLTAAIGLVAGSVLVAGAVTSAAADGSTPTPSSAPDDARHTMLHNILELHRVAGEFVGATIALEDADGTATEAVAGTPTVDPASGPVDPDVPWNIGSATKSFVAVVVLQLAEEGRLDLDAGIDGYLPDLAGASRITPRELLQHTSGLGEYLDQPAVVADLERTWTPDELIAVAEAGGRVGAPGEAFHYSNTNYIVLGKIIEQVTGRPWTDEVHDRIVAPLGLTATGPITDQFPTGYQLVDGAFVDTTRSADPSVGGAAGALASTDRDLLAFATAMRDGTLLSPASQAQMMTFVPGEDLSAYGITHSYGLGIERYVTDDITIIGHMGTGQAQGSFYGFDPDHGTAVAVMINTANPGPAALIGAEALTAAAIG